MPTKKKNTALSGEDKKLIEEIIRVDHAGEHGATQIYRGQLAIFKENTEFGKLGMEILQRNKLLIFIIIPLGIVFFIYLFFYHD